MKEAEEEVVSLSLSVLLPERQESEESEEEIRKNRLKEGEGGIITKSRDCLTKTSRDSKEIIHYERRAMSQS